jgi:GntR family transcriptional regulator
MRASLDALVREGLIERRRGKGTVVLRPRIEQSLAHFYSTAQEMRQRGARLRTRVLERGHLYPGEDVTAQASDCLGLIGPEYGGYIVRIRLVEDEPLLLETLTFPLDVADWLIESPAPSLPDPAEESYYDLLIERKGLHVTHAHETFRPDTVTGHEAELLDVVDGSPVFVIERASYAGERCVEWRQTIARGDRYTFVVDLVNPAEDVSS